MSTEVDEGAESFRLRNVFDPAKNTSTKFAISLVAGVFAAANYWPSAGPVGGLFVGALVLSFWMHLSRVKALQPLSLSLLIVGAAMAPQVLFLAA